MKRIAYGEDGFSLSPKARQMLNDRRLALGKTKYRSDNDVRRDDPDLIAVIELLHGHAGSYGHDIQIANIPDGYDYLIVKTVQNVEYVLCSKTKIYDADDPEIAKALYQTDNRTTSQFTDRELLAYHDAIVDFDCLSGNFKKVLLPQLDDFLTSQLADNCHLVFKSLKQDEIERFMTSADFVKILQECLRDNAQAILELE